MRIRRRWLRACSVGPKRPVFAKRAKGWGRLAIFSRVGDRALLGQQCPP